MLEHPGISSQRGHLCTGLKVTREIGGVRAISREVYQFCGSFLLGFLVFKPFLFSVTGLSVFIVFSLFIYFFFINKKDQKEV